MGYRLLSKYRSELMGCAILWVMLFHAADLDMGLPALEWFRAAGFGGVDIFILLSAMGLAMSLGRREQTYGAFMVRRARRIMPAYLLVMVPYTLWKMSIGTARPSALFWNATLLYYWVQPKGAFNWYAAGIMTFYALTPVCFRFLKSRRRREAWTAAAMVLSLFLCQMLMQDGYWGYTDVFYRLPVFFLGLLLGLYVLEERRLTAWSAVFWAAVFAAGFLYLPLAFRFDGRGLFLPVCHLFAFTTAPMCLAGGVLLEKLPLGGVRRFLRLVGDNSLGIYLLNVSVFYELEAAYGPRLCGVSNRLFFLAMFGCNLALGAALGRGLGARRAAGS